jgi:hypothetical protein
MRRILILFAAAMLALGMAGCGGGEPAEDRPAEEETAGTEETGTGETGETEEPETTEEGELGATAAQAIPLEPGVVEASLDPDRDEEWYVFELPAGGILELTFAPGDDTGRMNVTLLDSDMDVVEEEWDVRPPATSSFTHAIPAGEPQDFYVKVSQGEPGMYSLRLQLSSQDDAGSGGDAPGEAVDALQVEPEGTVSGMVADEDESDWYAVDLEPAQSLELAFTPGDDAEGINVGLYDPDQSIEWEEWDVAPGVTKSYTLQLGGEGGRWYVQVSQGHNGTYELSMSTSPQDDAGMGTDAPARPVEAMDADTLTSIAGRVAGYDEEDCYVWQVEEGESMTFAFTPGADSEGLNAEVLNPDQDVVWEEWDVAPGVTREYTIPLDSPAGPWYFRVSQGEDGDYTLEIR